MKKMQMDANSPLVQLELTAQTFLLLVLELLVDHARLDSVVMDGNVKVC